MVFLPKIEIKKTEDKVERYLEEEFPRLVVQAGYSMLEVQSPKFDSVGSSGSVRNSMEDRIVGHFDAQPKVIQTVNAINRCPKISKKILWSLYVKEMSNREAQLSIGYSRSQYGKLKKRALLWFADSFQRVQDLHVYKTVEKVDFKGYT